MAIDFHDERNRLGYAGRDADAGWGAAMRAIADPAGKRIADIGCGGGIYTAGWRTLGAAAAVGVDFSAAMIRTAREQHAGDPALSFRQGDAAATGLEAGGFDIVFSRALIHHLAALGPCFAEARRLVRPGGTAIVQERTIGDVDLPGSAEHLRGYAFERFPRLLAIEAARRPSREAVEDTLRRAGFGEIRARTFWETRRSYPDFAALAADLAARTGRSILHELNDSELTELIGFIETRLPPGKPIVEKDRWTIWSAQRI